MSRTPVKQKPVFRWTTNGGVVCIVDISGVFGKMPEQDIRRLAEALRRRKVSARTRKRNQLHVGTCTLGTFQQALRAIGYEWMDFAPMTRMERVTIGEEIE